jgi:hypothetical protein
VTGPYIPKNVAQFTVGLLVLIKGWIGIHCSIVCYSINIESAGIQASLLHFMIPTKKCRPDMGLLTTCWLPYSYLSLPRHGWSTVFARKYFPYRSPTGRI